MDYKEVLSNIVSLERRTLHLYSFICELSLLNTSLFVYSPARLAAAALLLAKILHGQGKESPFGGVRSMSVCLSRLGCLFLVYFAFRQDVPVTVGGRVERRTGVKLENEELSSV